MLLRYWDSSTTPVCLRKKEYIVPQSFSKKSNDLFVNPVAKSWQERIVEDGKWISLVVILFLFPLVIEVLIILRPSFRPLFLISIVTRVAFSGIIMVANALFIAKFEEADPFVYGSGIFLVLFILASNLGFAFHLRDICTPVNNLVDFLVFFPALLDVSVFHLFARGRENSETVDSYRIGNGFLFYFPMLVLFGLSNPTFIPVETIVALVFNLLAFFLLVGMEAYRWVLRFFFSPAKPSGLAAPDATEIRRSLKAPLLFSEDEGEEEGDKDGDGNIDKQKPRGRLFFPLYFVAFPLVLLSVIFQALTLFGIPFAGQTLRLYGAGFRGAKPLTGGHMFTWFEFRGFFLISLNLVWFGVIIMVLLPILAVLGITFAIGEKLLRNGQYRDFLDAVQDLVSLLAFCLIPYLETPPTLRIEKYLSAENFPRSKAAVALISFFLFDFILPAINAATSLAYFAVLVVTISSPDFPVDVYSTLKVLGALSLLSGLVGLLVMTFRLRLILVPFVQSPSFGRLAEVAISCSVFGQPPASALALLILLLVDAIGQDVLQVVVLFVSAPYAGVNLPLWPLKMALAVFSFSFNMSSLVQGIVFGNKTHFMAKSGLRLVTFVLFGACLAIVADLPNNSKFCEETRIVQRDVVLWQLGSCDTLTSISVEKAASLNETLSASQISANFSVTQNDAPVAIVFDKLGVLMSPFTVFALTENTAVVSVTFDSLEQLGSTLLVENNSGEISLNLASLFVVDGTGALVIQNNTGLVSASFSALFFVTGNCTLSLNVMKNIYFPFLVEIDGQFSVLEQTIQNQGDTVFFPLLRSVTGALSIWGNKGLLSLDFQALLEVSGEISVANNPDLTKFATSFESGSLNLVIDSNPALTWVSFVDMTTFTGSIVIHNNDRLQTLDFPALDVLDISSLQIDENENLVDLSISLVSGNLNLALYSNSKLESVAFPQLTTLNGTFTIMNNTSLQSLSFPNLVNFGHSANMILDLPAGFQSLNLTQLWCYANSGLIEIRNSSAVNILVASGCTVQGTVVFV